MHGRKREEFKNVTPEQLEEQRKQSERWAQAWERMLQLRRANALTYEALEVTQQLIEMNPDCYTPWNYRKQILLAKLSMPSSPEPEPQEEKRDEQESKPEEPKSEQTAQEGGSEGSSPQENKEEKVEPEVVEDEEAKKKREAEEEERKKREEEEKEKEREEAEKRALKEREEKITLREKKLIIQKELFDLTIRAIKYNHKSYNVWYHRRWIMLQMKKLSKDIHDGLEPKHSSDTLPDDVDWDNDLELTTKFLKLDSRNFHCWGYRKFIVHESNHPSEKELEYTEVKIGEGGKFFSDGGGKTAQECSFSNYSAWHLRSLLLTEKIESIKKTSDTPQQQIKELLDTEFDFLAQIVATHNGQSPWLYHRWLVGKVEDKEHKLETLRREIILCEEIIKIDTELSPNDPPPKWATLTKAFLLQGLKDVGETVEEQEIMGLLDSLEKNDPDHKNFYAHLKQKAAVRI